MAKKRLKKYQMGDLFNSNPGITLDNPSLLTTGMGVSLTALPEDNVETNQQLPKTDMPKLPSLNNQPMVAKPITYNKPKDPITINLDEKETSTNDSLFDMKRFAMLNMANSALSSFTSGINERRLKKSAIQNSQFNLPYTSFGSDTNKYGYYRMGGLRPYAQGGFINYYEDAYDVDEDEYDNYNYEEESVADEERLTEEDVEAMQQEEQVKLEEQQRLMQKQQRREKMLKYINSMRDRSRARIMSDDEDGEFPASYGMASIPQDRGKQFSIIKEAADKYGVPASILAGVYGAETGFGKHATMVSSAGAQGPFQFMPGTAAQYGVNPWDFNSAADGAARLLRDNYRTLGSWDKAVAAYNAGPGNIKKGIMPAETKAYVPKVMSYANAFSQQGFRDGGELEQYQRAGVVKQNPPIQYTKDQYNSDPVLRQNIQNYSDSLNLYNTSMNTLPSNAFNFRRYRPSRMSVEVNTINNLSNYSGYVDPFEKDKIKPYKEYDFIEKYEPASYHDGEYIPAQRNVRASGVLYKQPVQPYQLQKNKLPYLKSVPFINNKNTVAPAQKLNIPKMQMQTGRPIYGPGNTIVGYVNDNQQVVPAMSYTGAPNNELNLLDKQLLQNQEAWKKYVLSKDSSYKFAQGGNINKTGYTPGYKSFNNPYNIIPSKDITMENTPFPVLGIDASGYTQMMKPGGNYSFMKAPVLEIPAYKSFMQGGYNEQQPIYNIPSLINGGSLGSISPMSPFPPAARKSNSPKKSSLKQFKRGDVYYVDSATLANLKTANVKYKYI
jgi:hypothetical protein